MTLKKLIFFLYEIMNTFLQLHPYIMVAATISTGESRASMLQEGADACVGKPIRTIPNPKQAVDILILEHEKSPDNPYMFPSPKTGTMYDPDSFQHTHEKILAANTIGSVIDQAM